MSESKYTDFYQSNIKSYQNKNPNQGSAYAFAQKAMMQQRARNQNSQGNNANL